MAIAHSIPEQLELICKWNKPIEPRNAEEIDVIKRYSVIGKDGSILDKPIHLYRMWYRFLQLALELEQKEVKIITNNKRIKLKKKIKDEWGHFREYKTKVISKEIKIAKNKYKDWIL